MIDFSVSPFLVIWEVTRACDLACHHCRASAEPLPLPGELTPPEGKKLLDDIHEMGCKIVVLSGGDPMKRRDLCDLLAYGKSIGLRMATIPAATDLLTKEALTKIKNTGVDQIAFSLDFPTEKLHDEFRGTPGAYAKTMKAIEWAHDLDLPLQINTTITAQSLPYLRDMADFVEKSRIVFWEVFFLVPMGRGADLASLTADQCEEAFEILYDVQKRNSFVLKITEAPHYRRFVAQKEKSGAILPERLRRSEGPGGSMGLAPKAVNSGKGFCFVSYKGEIFPSGFLPIDSGNVRTSSIASVYRDSELFRSLRDSSQLTGACGECSFRDMCGGSRSRALALTGSHLAPDPWCVLTKSA